MISIDKLHADFTSFDPGLLMRWSDNAATIQDISCWLVSLSTTISYSEMAKQDFQQLNCRRLMLLLRDMSNGLITLLPLGCLGRAS